MNTDQVQSLLDEAEQVENSQQFTEAERLVERLLSLIEYHHIQLVEQPTSNLQNHTKDITLYARAYHLAGAINIRLGNYSNSLQLQNKALHLWQLIYDKKRCIEQKISLAALYSLEEWEEHDFEKAEEYLQSALDMSTEIHRKKMESQVHERLADLYMHQKVWGKFAEHFRLFVHIKDELQEEEAREQALKFEREKEKARLEATESLLHRMLPPSIVVRMMNGETNIADYHENISILFADIVGFTPLATDMSAASLLKFMNVLFERYDEIASKHECERIKTIGDGYLAICGAPLYTDNHLQRITNMALDMQYYVTHASSEHLDLLPKGMEFLVRIGLHCGPIVAGVIGTGKISYDIYGDTVNIAARMESHSEPNMIHVSKEFRDAYFRITGSKCYVATALADVTDFATLERLREFRDGRLQNHRAGRVFTRLYYRYGSVLAAVTDRLPQGMRKILGTLLDRFARLTE